MEHIVLSDGDWALVVDALRYKAEMNQARSAGFLAPDADSQLRRIGEQFKAQAERALNLASFIEQGGETIGDTQIKPKSRLYRVPMEPEQRSKHRYFITVLWHNQPEGGSYGTVIESEGGLDQAEIERLCHYEMAASEWDRDPNDPDDTVERYIERHRDEWLTVDCFDLDAFIERHMTAVNVGRWSADLPVLAQDREPLSEREIATVLAALRAWQQSPMRGDCGLDDIATDSGTVEALDADEIDDLCERINCGEDRPAPAPVKRVCVGCGSDDIVRDASARWSVPAQRWELSDVHDHATCNQCDGDSEDTEAPVTA